MTAEPPNKVMNSRRRILSPKPKRRHPTSTTDGVIGQRKLPLNAVQARDRALREADELAASAGRPKGRQQSDYRRKLFQTSRDIFGKDRDGLLRGLRGKTGDDLCIEPLPAGSRELPGFSTGYLIASAVVTSILAMELIVLILLQ